MKYNLAIKPVPVRIGHLSALLAGLLAFGPGHALQLGKHRGAAVMGQPLNIAVQAVVDAPDDLAAGCLEADVFYADSRVLKSRVRVSTEKSSASAQEVLIRIQSAAPIDEPVVTVYLRAGCQQKIEKRYVVLADMLSEPAVSAPITAPVIPPSARSAAAVGPGGSGAAAASPGASSAAQAKEARRAEREARRAERKAQAAEKAQATKAQGANPSPVDGAEPTVAKGSAAGNRKSPAPAAKSPAPEKQTSRLKLEPLELLAERDPALKASAELRSAPSTDPAQRAAAAALWRAIAAQPEDILGDSQKLKTLESVVSVLQLQMKQNQQGMQELGEDVKKAQSERFANPLVYGLGLLLFLAALALAWTLRRRASARVGDSAVQPWWRRSASQRIGWADSAVGAKSGGLMQPSESGAGYPPSSGDNSERSASFLDLDLSDASGQPASRSAAALRQEALSFKAAAGMHRDASPSNDATRKLRGDFALSAPYTGRAVKAEELFDVQQQADFFVSLGQKDQAIEVLRLHIEESEQTSALVYLDLLNLYHQTGEELEFEAFRLEFNARFNAEMPAFDAYTAASSSEGLQGYPTAMSRIVALWPSPKVVTVIEESLFRQVDSQTQTFDLEAYRELLLLYAMIKDLLHSQASGKTGAWVSSRPPAIGPIGFGADHDFQADSGMDRTQGFPGTSVVPLTATPSEGGELDIDFDLTGNSNGGFRPDKVEPADAQLPPDRDINKLRAQSAQPASATDGPALFDGNAIDFDFDQIGQIAKPTVKKSR